MNITFEIKDLKRVRRQMDALPDKLQRQTILPILRKSTRPLINTAKSKLLSHGQNYSSLAKSIGNITAKSKNAIIYVGPRVKGKWKYIGYYAAWVEYGVKGIKKSRGGSAKKAKDKSYAGYVAGIKKGGRYRKDQPARPFMRPAIDNQKSNIGGLLTKNFAKYLDKVIQRNLKKL